MKFCFYTTLVLLLAITGCHRRDRRLTSAMTLAGDNASELQKVLAHYQVDRADSLKYQAAVFLIENMPGKCFYAGGQFDEFLDYIKSPSNDSLSTDNWKDSLRSFWEHKKTLVGSPDKVYDINTIKADFLISNIDQAFLSFSASPWKKDFSFVDFCEYVLPYRIGTEPLENFRTFFLHHLALKKPLKKMTISEAADSILAQTSKMEFDVIVYPDFTPDFPPSALVKLKGGTCREVSNLAAFAMRSYGLPIALDFTPQWPHRGMGHSWSAMLLNSDSCIDFEGSNATKLGGHLFAASSGRIGKIYRHMYGQQEESLAMLHGSEDIPPVFQDSCIKDVSSSYYRGQEVTVELSLQDTRHHNFAYLSVFDNEKWVPIAWTRIADHNAIFHNMGKTAIYQPSIYSDHENVPVEYPLLIDSNGNIKRLIPDERRQQKLILYRKYPVFGWWNTRLLAMKGGHFQAANKADFSDSVNFYTIDSVPEMTYYSFTVNLSKGYRFWRYIAPNTFYGDIAELEFYNEQNQPVRGAIIGRKVKEKTVRENAFDGDPLTFYQGETQDSNWVGMAFDKPQKIKTIRYLCRNDDNFIKKDETYELYFWKNNEWVSLGKQTGDDRQFLVYDGIPANALFLLRNKTKGHEERIFTYENNKQIWW